MVCLIKCAVVYHSSFFRNVIVDISQYRLIVGNYNYHTDNRHCRTDVFPLLYYVKTRYESVYIHIYIYIYMYIYLCMYMSQ